MIVSELQYFPPITFFSTLYTETYVYLDVYELYRKMSFRNRCLIAGAQGIISFSVPLQDGRNQQLPVNEVMISDAEKWQARHFKSIQSAYNRSPFFEYYQDELLRIYQQPFFEPGRLESALSELGERKTGLAGRNPFYGKCHSLSGLRNG